MDRVAEELECMSTIVRSIAVGLSVSFDPSKGSQDRTAIGSEEAVALWDLATQLLTSDCNKYRLEALLTEVQPSIPEVIGQVLATNPLDLGIAGNRIHVAAFNALRAILSMAQGELREPVAQVIAHADLIEVVVRHVALIKSDYLSVACECLYHSVHGLGLVADVVKAGGPDVLIEVVGQCDASVVARRYAALALLECCPMCSRLAVDNFGTLALCVRDEGDQEFFEGVVLRLVNCACSNEPEYTGVVLESSGVLRTAIPLSLRFIARDDEASVELGCMALQQLCRSLCARDWWETDGLFQTILENGVIAVCLSSAGNSRCVTYRCEALLSVFEAARGFKQVNAAVHAVVSSNSTFSALLSVACGVPPRMDDPEGNLQIVGALCVSNMLAKSPAFRLRVRQSVEDFPAWLGNLRASLVQNLEHAFEQGPTASVNAFESAIVDGSGLLLNSVQYVDASAPRGWTDMCTMESLLAHLFAEQQRACGFSSTVGKEPEANDVTSTAPPADRTAFLTFAVLCFGVQATFSPTVPHVMSTENLYSSEESEPIDQPEPTRSVKPHFASSIPRSSRYRPTTPSKRPVSRPWR